MKNAELEISTNLPFSVRPIPTCADNEYRETAWGIVDPEGKGALFEQIEINRPKVGPQDVRFNMLYCGVCHSDVTIGLNHLSGAMYPMVPGHELCGEVVEVGSNVTKVKAGDRVGVGCIVDSCLECDTCKGDDEQYCENGLNCHTYNDTKRYGHIGGNPDTQTFGGYSCSQVVHEHFIIKIPDTVPLEKAGPIMCAGITLYDPLRHWGATKGTKMKIGIAGIGGLGTMGIKLAKALGHEVWAISSSTRKEMLAKSKGADHYVVWTDPKSVEENKSQLDLILNTISAEHDPNCLLPLLKSQSTLVQIGLVTKPHTINQLSLIMNRKKFAGSNIGGIKATQEVMDLCGKHQIFPDTEMITAKDLESVWQKLTQGNADGIRYVIDINKSKASIQDTIIQ